MHSRDLRFGVRAERDIIREELFKRAVFMSEVMHEFTPRESIALKESRQKDGGYIGKMGKVDESNDLYTDG